MILATWNDLMAIYLAHRHRCRALPPLSTRTRFSMSASSPSSEIFEKAAKSSVRPGGEQARPSARSQLVPAYPWIGPARRRRL